MKAESHVGERIRDLRQEKLMTQTELAGDRITRNMLSLIEHGNSEPSLTTLRYLARRLNVSVGYLLSDDGELSMYRRHARIVDIRFALRTGEYAICRDLCRSLISGDGESDDELNLLLALSSIGLAIEEIGKGRLHGVADLLDDAVQYAGRTIYSAEHVYAEAAVLSCYLRRFSDALYADAEAVSREKGIPLSAAGGNAFCAYVLLLLKIDSGDFLEDASFDELVERLAVKSPALGKHLEAMTNLANGKKTEALVLFEELLRMNDPIPEPMLYEIFRDREICARDTGDYKGAYESASAKNELLIRILSEN